MRNRCKRSPPIRGDHYNPGVTAYYFGELTGMFGITILGIILLIVGLRRRSRTGQPPGGNPMIPPGYPPPAPYPFGYPPPSYPQPPTYPPPYPAGYPAEPPRRRSGTALIVVGSILLAFGVLGIVSQVGNAASRAGRSARSANVGQCIGAFNMQEQHVRTATPQDCDKPDSVFEVASKGGPSAKCPDGKLEDSKYAYHFDGATTLCLILNLKQGQCLTATGTAERPNFAVADCAGSARVIKVVKRIDGSSDTELCPEGTKAISYPSPARLYCLERIENN
jgi:hypothetical protein